MLQVERELSITLKCDGEEVTAEILEPLSGDCVKITESLELDERNPVWRERVSDEIYSWIEMAYEGKRANIRY